MGNLSRKLIGTSGAFSEPHSGGSGAQLPLGGAAPPRAVVSRARARAGRAPPSLPHLVCGRSAAALRVRRSAAVSAGSRAQATERRRGGLRPFGAGEQGSGSASPPSSGAPWGGRKRSGEGFLMLSSTTRRTQLFISRELPPGPRRGWIIPHRDSGFKGSERSASVLAALFGALRLRR